MATGPLVRRLVDEGCCRHHASQERPLLKRKKVKDAVRFRHPTGRLRTRHLEIEQRVDAEEVKGSPFFRVR